MPKSLKSIKITSLKKTILLGYDNFYRNIKIYNSNQESFFKVEIAESELAGFGNQVIRIKKKFSDALVCYINEKKQLFFPKPIQHNDFMQVYNLIETYQLFLQEEEKAGSL